MKRSSRIQEKEIQKMESIRQQREQRTKAIEKIHQEVHTINLTRAYCCSG